MEGEHLAWKGMSQALPAQLCATIQSQALQRLSSLGELELEQGEPHGITTHSPFCKPSLQEKKGQVAATKRWRQMFPHVFTQRHYTFLSATAVSWISSLLSSHEGGQNHITGTTQQGFKFPHPLLWEPKDLMSHKPLLTAR